jgi:transcriptional regulator with XRE-family HTH domain
VKDIKPETLGERIKLARIKSGLTLKQLADRVGIRKQTVSSFEQSTFYPSYKTLLTLADCLGCSLDYLSGRDEDYSPLLVACPAWLEDLLPVLETLDRKGRNSVKSFVLALDSDDLKIGEAK